MFIRDVQLGTNSIFHLIKILDKIEFIEYDFILIGGDLIDSSSFNLSELSIFKKRITKPIYFVTGNHEYYIENYQDKLNTLNKFGIITLNNNNISFGDINLVGIDDKQLPAKQVDRYLENREDNKFNILLVHKPSIWEKINDKTDLMLSGHCHNGQIMPFNLLVRFRFKYIYGLHKHNSAYLYVSSGSACWGPRMRVGTYNEINVIQINSK